MKRIDENQIIWNENNNNNNNNNNNDTININSSYESNNNPNNNNNNNNNKDIFNNSSSNSSNSNNNNFNSSNNIYQLNSSNSYSNILFNDNNNNNETINDNNNNNNNNNNSEININKINNKIINRNNNSNNKKQYNNINLINYGKTDKEFWKTRFNIGFGAIIFLELLFFFCYFPYVIYYTTRISNGETPFADIIILLLFHFIFLITQISLIKTTFSDPGGIPQNFPEFLLETQDLDSISFYESNSLGENRKCSKCLLNKPDRAHHCSKCKRCILKMDHHCPFVNNCIGYFNYKFFFLFLMWTTILCFYVLITTVSNFIGLIEKVLVYNSDHSISVVLGVIFIIALVFGIGLAFFSMSHLIYILRNESTIEHFEKNSKLNNSKANIYNLGARKNFKQVFGNNPFKWFLPVLPDTTPLSGLEFPVKSEKSPLISVLSS